MRPHRRAGEKLFIDDAGPLGAGAAAPEREAQALGVAVMFVRTQLPGLYQALGWQLVETRDGLAILGRNLAGDAAAPLGAAPRNAAPFSAPPACRPT